MSKYTVHIAIELEDDHGFTFSKELFKYLLMRDLIEHSEIGGAFCINSIDVEGIDHAGIQDTARLQ